MALAWGATGGATGVGIDTILSVRRDGDRLTDAQIRAFVAGVVDGSVTRAQAAAFLAFTAVRGMADDETAALTWAMTESGDQLSWPGLDGPFVDKHSTGGVGDKVSLVLAPLWAELGVRVPMISGRGLEHTGGTLDKLESIPAFRTDRSAPELRRTPPPARCSTPPQPVQLPPADRPLHALRNLPRPVPTIPPTPASLRSRKLSQRPPRLGVPPPPGARAAGRRPNVQAHSRSNRRGRAAAPPDSGIAARREVLLGRGGGQAEG